MEDLSIWIFHGSNAKFSSGVFQTKELAEYEIFTYKLSGILTKYPLNSLVYSWAVKNNLYNLKDESQTLPNFIQKFTSASQEHFHYDNGIIE